MLRKRFYVDWLFSDPIVKLACQAASAGLCGAAGTFVSRPTVPRFSCRAGPEQRRGAKVGPQPTRDRNRLARPGQLQALVRPQPGLARMYECAYTEARGSMG
jgi:hypothetical protein